MRTFRDARGLSLVEILVAVVVLSVALLAITTAGTVAGRQLFTGRRDVGVWTAMQQQVEVLMGQGYKNVTSGSAVVRGYPMQWTLSGTNPKKVILEATWTTQSLQVVKDTLVLYLAARDTL